MRLDEQKSADPMIRARDSIKGSIFFRNIFNGFSGNVHLTRKGDKMSVSKFDGEVILGNALENATRIQDLLDDIVAMVPDEDRHYADSMKMELMQRMFYQDYLYDVHGTFIERPTVLLDFEEMGGLLKFAGLM